MAGSSEIRAGRAFVEIAAKDKGFAAGLDKAARKLRAFGATVTKIGGALAAFSAAGFGVLAAAVKSFTESGSNLADMAARTGATVEALSALGFAAQQTGADLTDVEAAMRHMARGVGAVLGMSPDQQFEAMLLSIAAIEDPTERAARAMELFGKSGTKLIPMAMDLKKLTDEAKALGIVMSTEDAQAADELGDAWDRLKSTAGGLKNIVGAALAPALTKLLETAQRIVTSTIKWVDANRGLVVSLAKGLAVIGALGAGLMVVGTTITALGIGLSFLLTPIGAFVGGMVAAGAALVLLVRHTELGRKVLESWGEVFQRIWGGVKDALMSGDLVLAWKIVLAGMKVELQTAIVGMQLLWQSLKANVLIVFEQMLGGAKIAFLKLSSFMAKVGIEMDVLAGTLDRGLANIANAANEAATAMALEQVIADTGAAIAEVAANAGVAGMGAAADLAAAEAELKSLLDRARRQALGKPGRMGPFPGGGLQSRLPSGISSGSFDPNAAASLGRTRPIEQQTVDELKDINANIEELTSVVKESGLKFV